MIYCISFLRVFPVVSVHMLSLSPFLFAVLMDKLVDLIRQESSQTMMFSDDVVIFSFRQEEEDEEEPGEVEICMRGMKVSRTETECTVHIKSLQPLQNYNQFESDESEYPFCS